jgi:cell division protein FtsB
MRWPALFFFLLLVALQYPLWFAHGGWMQVRDAEAQLQTLREANQKLEQRNAEMAEEVKDLKTGYDAIEEKARFELGLIKQGEVFVQIPDAPLAGSSPR